MTWLPSANVFVLQEALPLAESASVAHPATALPPSKKEALPVGVPADPETVAVSVTAWFTVEGLALEVTATVALAFVGALTTCVTALDVRALYCASPE